MKLFNKKLKLNLEGQGLLLIDLQHMLFWNSNKISYEVVQGLITLSEFEETTSNINSRISKSIEILGTLIKEEYNKKTINPSIKYLKAEHEYLSNLFDYVTEDMIDEEEFNKWLSE
jgi:hypothetical protein